MFKRKTSEETGTPGHAICRNGIDSWNRPRPVSYTHLDVYKRQRLYSAGGTFGFKKAIH